METVMKHSHMPKKIDFHALDSVLPRHLTFKTGTAERIDITYVKNPESFYVRPVQCREFVPLLEAPSEKQPDHIQIGHTVVYKSKKLKKFIRGCITTDTDKHSYGVHAIDYGFLETLVDLSNVFEPKICYERRFIRHCSLMCIPVQKKWSDECIYFFKQLIASGPVYMTVVSETPWQLYVELQNSRGTISDTMIMTDHAYFWTEAMQNIDWVIENVYTKYQNPQIGERLNVHLLWVDIEHKTFYVHLANNLELYSSYKAHLIAGYNTFKVIFPKDIRKGMVVAAKGKGRVHRGIVVEIPENSNKIVVHLVDTCHKSEYLISNIRYLPKEHLELPAMALFCTVVDNGSWHKIVGKSSFHLQSLNITIIQSGLDQTIPYTVQLNV